MPVSRLILELSHPEPAVRRAAARELARLDPETAAGAIVFLLKDPEPEIRREVAGILSRLGRTAEEPVARYLSTWEGPLELWVIELVGELKLAEGVDFLLRHLNEPDPMTRRAIAVALGRIGAAYADAPGITSTRALEGLLELLRDLNPEVQVAAAEALAGLGRQEAVNPLLDELQDENPQVRRAAAVALGRIGVPVAAAELVRLANNDPFAEVRQAAREALERISDRSVRSLLEALTAENLDEREAALRQLLDAGPAALPPLIRLAGSDDSGIRRLVAWVLGMLGEEAGLATLFLLTEDSEGGVRLAAIQALSRIRHLRAAERLSRLLEDADPKIAGMAANALERLGELAVEPVFGILTHQSPDVRVRAIDVLGRLRHEGAVERLISGLDDSSYWVRLVSAQALGEIGDVRAVPALIERLDDPDRLVRAMSAEALGKLRDYRASMKLLERVEDESDLVRANVFLALGRIGNPIAVPFLMKALDDPEVRVRLAAIEALGLLRAKAAREKLRAIARPWPWSREPGRVKDAARWALSMIDSSGTVI
ncbi:MAG: HEAT repeat domain-containing protein [candidate division WOR-3 bacterium]